MKGVKPRPFTKVKNWFKEQRRVARIRSATNKVRKWNNQQKNALNKATNLQNKTRIMEAKNALRQQQIDYGAKKGGIVGKHYRNLKLATAKNEAAADVAKMKPSMKKEAFQTKLKTERDVKVTRAKGAAFATGASALGATIYKSKEKDAEARIKEAEADMASYEAINSDLSRVKSVNTDPDAKSVSGLVTGVR